MPLPRFVALPARSRSSSGWGSRSLHQVLGLVLLLACLPCCGDLEVRSIASTDVVPASLQGFWTGTWQSDVYPETGVIELRIQEYNSEPLVAVTIDNPCIIPGDYELLFAQGTISLSIDDRAVLEARLDGNRELTGSFGCDADRGTWQAAWVEGLPDVIDLSGAWDGRVLAAGQPERLVSINLAQRVRGGTLVLEGSAELPGVLPFPVPLQGFARFRADDFELRLQTVPGSEPQIVLTGVGERDTLDVPIALLQVLSLASLPFGEAVVELVRRP